ncbi:MAG: AmmeMemoRadiSam system protein A [Nanoarchaeota archaeon]|nr:AmmeMemoRadiSam system protein A [Nanoarchaeota archaeon]MBU1975290.1 AmmeMemoRadiSam system protein A [Nanoarchaeota archaeon]
MEEADKSILLTLARDSITTYFKEEKPDISKAKHLNQKLGVFVTLHKKGDLRGCIGFPHAIHPLYQGVIEGARSAAFGDPRFPPLLETELSHIDIEISVLTKPTRIHVKRADDYLKEINVGQDGLIINNAGLLLPQVATEQDWTAGQFLNAICQKAGMPFDAWRDLENHLYKFQAIIFNEK